MADRFPLILNTNTNQIQEIPSGDNLDLTGVGINNVGVITSGNVTIGAATTDLVVTGDARITGILTVGTSSLKLDGPNNLVNVGTALTLGHTQGVQFHTQNLHSAGFEVNQINASGIITATEADINGDLDVDGHTNLDNLSVAGVSTFGGTLNGMSADFAGQIQVGTNNSKFGNNYLRFENAGIGYFDHSGVGQNINFRVTNSSSLDTTPLVVKAAGIDVTGNITATGNVSVGGVLTYEDVTNVDSIGIITARNGINVSSGTATFQGAIDANGDIDVDGHTNLDNVSVAGVSTFAGDATFNGGAGAVTIPANSDMRFINGTWSGDVSGNVAKIQHHSNILYISGGSSGIYFRENNTNRWFISDGGHFISGADSTYDIGTNGNRVRNGYFDTLYGDGSNLTGIDTDLVSDTSPQLGGPLNTNTQIIKFPDSNGSTNQAVFGTGNDLKIYHQSNSSYIINSTGNLNIGSNNEVRIKGGSDVAENMAVFKDNGSVELYHDAAKKLETYANGIIVYGPESGGGLINLYADEGDDNADKWRLHANPNGSFYLQNYSQGSWHNNISGAGGGEATLYFNNTAKLLTEQGGINVKSPGSDWNNIERTSNGYYGFAFRKEDGSSFNGYLGFTGGGSEINNTSAAQDMVIRSETNIILSKGYSTRLLKTDGNGAVSLYYGNVEKFKTSSSGVSITGQATATGNSAMYRAVESGGATVEIRCGGSEGYVGTSSNHKVSLITNGTRRWEISGAGHFIPYANDTYDIGSSSYRVRDIYTGDLNLSNVAKKDKGGNDVDGTWGDFTIQEGESDLFLINNRSGKKYKFNLTEVS